MKQFIRLTLVLAFVAAAAAGALAMTYGATETKIQEQEKAAKVSALKGIFFLMKDVIAKPVAEGNDKVMAIYMNEGDQTPAYYVAEGSAVGYNASVPIQILVGFTNDQAEAKKLLEGYADTDKLPAAGEKGFYIVGWKVVKSEETPGLGEKAKDSKAAYTWYEKITGSAKDPGPDLRTDFQRQFSGNKAPTINLKVDGGTLDGITASTYSSRGIVAAVRNASKNLQDALSAGK
ncbi:MAG: FMN-binding protein [Planctomycetes bacterium]|nr:FMN-binding protein [Planctomycetota bacterium]